jgi:hypothetical protein
MDSKLPEAVYLPSNEPYLGRESVYRFDNVIMSCLELNTKVANYTHNHDLTDLQKAACQLIPQGINIALTIRELVRQGYLFGAYVLIRPLLERAVILRYLDANPSEISVWNNGWKYKERPPLKKMMEAMISEADVDDTTLKNMAKTVCDTFNHIVHGDPNCSSFNMVELKDGVIGYSVGKNITSPEMCDDICFQSYCYLIVLSGMMAKYFPGVK